MKNLSTINNESDIVTKGYVDANKGVAIEADPLYIADKPNIAFKNNLPTKVSELENDKGFLSNIPTASDAILGGIKVGENLSIDEQGILSVNPLTYDTVPTEGSTNLVNSGNIKKYVDNNGGGTPYIIQIDEPTDKTKIWIDPDDNSETEGVRGHSYIEKQLISDPLNFSFTVHDGWSILNNDIQLLEPITNFNELRIKMGIVHPTKGGNYNIVMHSILVSDVIYNNSSTIEMNGSHIQLHFGIPSYEHTFACWFKNSNTIHAYQMYGKDPSAVFKQMQLISIKGIKY